MQLLKQSTSVTVRIGPFVDQADGYNLETGLTISQADIRLSKNGGDFAQSNDSGGATHDENGWYYLTLDTTDTGTLGRLDLYIYESGALQCWREFMILPAVVYDSLVGGSDYLQTDVRQVEGTDATTAINDEVVDVLSVDTYQDITQQAPPATPTFAEMVRYLYFALRNEIEVTSTEKRFMRDDGSTVAWKKALSDSGTLYTEAEGASGP